MPAFLQFERGFEVESAARWAAVLSVSGTCGVLLGGLLTDKLKSRRKCIVWPCLILPVLMVFLYQPDYGMIVMVNVVAFFGGLPVSAIFSAASELVRREEAEISMAILAIGQNLGMFLGPAVYGFIAQNYGWDMAAYSTLPLLALGFFGATRLKMP
jgi:predicted MFS family arabinose efflux permease